MPALLTTTDVANRYGIHKQTVYLWMTKWVCGVRLEYTQIGGSRRIREDDLILFFREIKRKKEKGK